MPRRKFIDKKTSTTYALVHRAQNDPRIHDEDAPDMVFAEKAQPRRPTEDDYAYSSAGSVVSLHSAYRSGKARERGDLEDEFGLVVRKNEGEAAQHGVFWDDSEYDYMQHMRDLGAGEGAVTWVEASAPSQRQRGKGKERLEDALRSIDLDDEDEQRLDETQSVGTTSTTASTRSLFPEEMFGSEFVKKRTYQDQQDIPDDIAGLQPDMDPALREVLEALDDEAYVMDDDEDFFAELTGDGYEVERDEWERMAERRLVDEDEDDGWESEDTVRASSPPLDPPPALELPDGEAAKPPEDTQAQPPADPTDGAWIDEFKKFKSATKSSSAPRAAAAAPPSGLESSALASLATGRKKKKRKGAKTSTTNYSMTSSALARTDQQTLLDSRFDKLEAAYEADECPDDADGDSHFNDDVLSAASGITELSQASQASKASKVSKYSAASGISKASGVSNYSRASDAGAPQSQRADFESIMDDFLSGYSKSGKMGRRGKRGRPGGGIEQLDEVRKGLGPARVKTSVPTATS